MIYLLILLLSITEPSDHKTYWLGEHIYDGQTFSRNLTVTVPSSNDALNVSCWWGSSNFTVWCPDTDNRFYLREDGNFEWEFILLKPGENHWTFKYDSDSLRFLYQPPDKNRDDSVVASYAVYTTIGWGNIYYRDGYREIFKCGKAFHIYRPKAIDANGDWIYGDQRIENGIWAIWFDSIWMANATYPVVIDPTIGSTANGASVRAVSASDAYMLVIPSGDITESGTADSVSARCNYNNATVGDFQLGLFNVDAGVASDSIATTGTFNHCTNVGYFWTPNTDCASPADGGGVAITGTISSGTSYAILYAVDGVNTAIRYDTDASYTSGHDFGDNFPLPSPSNCTDNENNEKYTFHLVYTAGATSSPRIIMVGGGD